jgi:hypothetical protein
VQFFKRQWPIIVAFLLGMIMWVRYYIPTTTSQWAQDEFNTWARLLFGFAAILGILSLLHHHFSKIKLKKPGFGFSYVTLVAFVIMGAAGLFPIPIPGFAEVYNRSGGLHVWMFDNMFVPMQATMFSVLAFFIASAAFRAFRARSVEATALLIAGCIMMIGRVPVGDWLAQNIENAGAFFSVNGNSYSLLDFPEATSWLLNVPNAAAKRGIILGVLLSQIAIAIRIIFGIERTYMGGGD